MDCKQHSQQNSSPHPPPYHVRNVSQGKCRSCPNPIDKDNSRVFCAKHLKIIRDYAKRKYREKHGIPLDAGRQKSGPKPKFPRPDAPSQPARVKSPAVFEVDGHFRSDGTHVLPYSRIRSTSKAVR